MKYFSSPAAASDMELWYGIVKDDAEAFDQLFKRYWEPLVRFAALYLPDRSESEEVLQELFIELYQKRHVITIQSSVSSFLISFARNRILNYLRHKSTYKRHIATASTRGHAFYNHTQETVDFRDIQERIQSTVANMPPKYRQVYILRKEYRFTIAKTAQVLKRPVATVEKQLRKALLFLRDDLRGLAEMQVHVDKMKI